MVEYRAVERFNSAGEAAGGMAVGCARRCIAARMIVSENDAGAAVAYGVSDDGTQGEIGLALIPLMPGDV